MYYTVYKIEQVTSVGLPISAILALFSIGVPLQLYAFCVSLTSINHAEEYSSLQVLEHASRSCDVLRRGVG